MFSLIGKAFVSVARGVANFMTDAVAEDDTSFWEEVVDEVKDCAESNKDSDKTPDPKDP